jgi:hypothetical protein
MMSNLPPAPGPRQILAAFAAQTVTAEQVMRALTEHDGWYAPAGFALSALDRRPDNVYEGAVIFSEQFEADPAKLLLFTDREAALRADGHRIGLFTSAFRGARIFAALGNEFQSVSINPCSPQAECWFIARDAFPLAHLWAQVVDLETALATPGPLPHKQLATHPGFVILINQQNLPVTMTQPSLEGPYAVAFTAPDLYAAFIARQPAENQAALNRATLDGASLFRQLPQFDVAGVWLNPGNTSSSVAIPASAFQKILDA